MMPREGFVRFANTGYGKLIWSGGQLSHVSATSAVTAGEDAGQFACKVITHVSTP